MLKSTKLRINYRTSHWMASTRKFPYKWNNIISYTFKRVMPIFLLFKWTPSLFDKIIVWLIYPHYLINKILIRE
jgi:hypothetical protein